MRGVAEESCTKKLRMIKVAVQFRWENKFMGGQDQHKKVDKEGRGFVTGVAHVLGARLTVCGLGKGLRAGHAMQ